VEVVKVVIMAGGRGRRLSPSKPLLRVCGRRLIDWVYDLAEEFGSVVVATCPGHPVDRLKVDKIYTSGAGYEEDVVKAVRTVGFPALVLPADVPFLPKEIVFSLISGCKTEVCTLKAGGKFLGVSYWRGDKLELYSQVEVEREITNVNSWYDLHLARVQCRKLVLEGCKGGV
jgi:GTP:adenosylcobinamide-phosphate guanylyltransferase